MISKLYEFGKMDSIEREPNEKISFFGEFSEINPKLREFLFLANYNFIHKAFIKLVNITKEDLIAERLEIPENVVFVKDEIAKKDLIYEFENFEIFDWTNDFKNENFSKKVKKRFQLTESELKLLNDFTKIDNASRKNDNNSKL